MGVVPGKAFAAELIRNSAKTKTMVFIKKLFFENPRGMPII